MLLVIQVKEVIWDRLVHRAIKVFKVFKVKGVKLEKLVILEKLGIPVILVDLALELSH